MFWLSKDSLLGNFPFTNCNKLLESLWKIYASWSTMSFTSWTTHWPKPVMNFHWWAGSCQSLIKIVWFFRTVLFERGFGLLLSRSMPGSGNQDLYVNTCSWRCPSHIISWTASRSSHPDGDWLDQWVGSTPSPLFQPSKWPGGNLGGLHQGKTT